MVELLGPLRQRYSDVTVVVMDFSTSFHSYNKILGKRDRISYAPDLDLWFSSRSIEPTRNYEKKNYRQSNRKIRGVDHRQSQARERGGRRTRLPYAEVEGSQPLQRGRPEAVPAGSTATAAAAAAAAR